MTALEEWFNSKRGAIIAGHTMRPREQAPFKIPFEMMLGQATSYWLDADDNTTWILKRFLPAKQPQRSYVEAVAGCIPHLLELRCGWKRRVLTPHDLKPALGKFASQELGTWLDGTVLMPRLTGESWGDLLTGVAEGRIVLTPTERLAIARRLAEAIRQLELADISHRDLSTGNILVDRRSNELHLIDWDALFHPTLLFQQNTTMGTACYIAPWINVATQSWCPHADRFALAVCLVEILTVQLGVTLHGEGSLFPQQALGRDAAVLSTANAALNTICTPAAVLFRTAWHARDFDACPSPADWLSVLPTTIPSPPVVVPGQPTPLKPLTAPQASELPEAPDFSAFVEALAQSSPTVTCSMGHVIHNLGSLRVCPECAKKGRTTAFYGWRQASCGHQIPDRSCFCPKCGKPTGW